MKKNKKITVIIVALFLITVFGLIGMSKSYASKQLESDTLPDNTIINGIDVSSMTKLNAEQILTKSWNSQNFEITQDGEKTDVLSLNNVKYDINDSIDSVVSKAGIFAYIKHTAGKPYELTIPMTVQKAGKQFRSEFKSFCDKLDEGTVHTEDAYVDLSNTDFTVVEEVYGDNVDRKLLRSTIFDLISEGTMTLEYNKDDFIEKPVITADSREIKNKLDYCKTYLSEKITYTFGKETLTLTPEQIDKMIYLSDSNEVKVRNKAVKEFISDLSMKYDTYGCTRTFKTAKQGIKQVSGGAYGYVIDKKEEKNRLTKDLKSGKDVTREPVYSYKGNGRNGRDDIGKTYCEVDLSNQHVYYFKNGKCIFDTPCVSGCTKNGTGTITGTYSLAYKERDATLKGQNIDGSDYESKVGYWMPFCNGYGLHDADWRTKFGGSIYITNGSHGCINLPPAKAAELFSIIQTKDVIIIYY